GNKRQTGTHLRARPGASSPLRHRPGRAPNGPARPASGETIPTVPYRGRAATERTIRHVVDRLGPVRYPSPATSRKRTFWTEDIARIALRKVRFPTPPHTPGPDGETNMPLFRGMCTRCEDTKP